MTGVCFNKNNLVNLEEILTCKFVNWQHLHTGRRVEGQTTINNKYEYQGKNKLQVSNASAAFDEEPGKIKDFSTW